jgi:adenylate cyclase
VVNNDPVTSKAQMLLDDSKKLISPGVGKRILWISLALLGAQLIGSAFNIWYNLSHIRPLLDAEQMAAFVSGISYFNAITYPIALAIWIGIVRSISKIWKSGDPTSDRWKKATRRMINLPWIAIGVSGATWFLSIPVLLLAVHSAPGILDSQVNLHLPVSIVIAALISLALGFFIVEILTQKLLYPLFLDGEGTSDISGTFQITLKRRGMIWAVSAVACPILSLMLLFVVSEFNTKHDVWFPLSVGAVGIAFGFVSVWLLAKIVIEPVEALRRSARHVGEGNLDTRINLLRTDEFGTLIHQFNSMVGGLKEKRHVEEVLGRNVGLEVARHLLQQGEELMGTEKHITVFFTDIRNFTPRCASSAPRDVVKMLNIFFDVMVPEIEARNGIVNQFAGDGFMAIFGAITKESGHENDAVAAGCAMIGALSRVNAELADEELEPIQIGVGINSGPAVIGSVGTSGRTSYTAVGDTVNVSARIESLTKETGFPLLLSASTYDALTSKPDAVRLEPMAIKGKTQPIDVYGIRCE